MNIRRGTFQTLASNIELDQDAIDQFSKQIMNDKNTDQRLLTKYKKT